MTPTFVEAVQREEVQRLANECWEKNQGFVLDEAEEEQPKIQYGHDICYD